MRGILWLFLLTNLEKFIFQAFYEKFEWMCSVFGQTQEVISLAAMRPLTCCGYLQECIAFVSLYYWSPVMKSHAQAKTGMVTWVNGQELGEWPWLLGKWLAKTGYLFVWLGTWKWVPIYHYFWNLCYIHGKLTWLLGTSRLLGNG